MPFAAFWIFSHISFVFHLPSFVEHNEQSKQAQNSAIWESTWFFFLSALNEADIIKLPSYVKLFLLACMCTLLAINWFFTISVQSFFLNSIKINIMKNIVKDCWLLLCSTQTVFTTRNSVMVKPIKISGAESFTYLNQPEPREALLITPLRILFPSLHLILLSCFYTFFDLS